MQYFTGIQNIKPKFNRMMVHVFNTIPYPKYRKTNHAHISNVKRSCTVMQGRFYINIKCTTE